MKGYIFCKPNIIVNYSMFLKMFARKMDTRTLFDVSIFKPAFQISKPLRKTINQGTRNFASSWYWWGAWIGFFNRRIPSYGDWKTFSPWRENMVRIGSFWLTMSPEFLCQQITPDSGLYHFNICVSWFQTWVLLMLLENPKKHRRTSSPNVIEDSIMVLLEDNSKVKAFWPRWKQVSEKLDEGLSQASRCGMPRSKANSFWEWWTYTWGTVS